MRKFLLPILTLSICGTSFILLGCEQQTSAPDPVITSPTTSSQVIEVQNLLQAEAQKAVETKLRENEAQQLTEALNRQQAVDAAALHLNDRN